MNSRLARPFFSLVTLASLLLSAQANAQKFKDTYPRIGAYEISGGKRMSDPDYRDSLAKHDVLIVGLWRRWATTDEATGQRMQIRDAVVDIKKRARAIGNDGILIANYTIINEVFTDEKNTSQREKREKLWSEVGPGYRRNNDWYARDANGNYTSSWRGTWHANITEHVRRDSNGDTYPEWVMEHDYEIFFRDVPEFDFWFVDNFFYRPRVKADWDGDGKIDDRNNERVRRDFRKGYVNAVNRIEKLMPGMLVMGNVEGDGTSNGMLLEDEYRGRVAALIEGAIGVSYSIEGWGGWELMMQRYRITASNAKRNLVLITVHGHDDDYATMRYGLTSTLMDDGYYYYTDHDENYRSALWFDEYDSNLGRAIDPPQFNPWRGGVYRRRFENGVAFVNPKGNGRRTIDIGPGYRHIDGTQDRSVNNGKPATKITLNERDGVILVKVDQGEDPVRPKPPVLTVID